MTEEIFKTLFDNCIACFLRGSYLYGTLNEKSDIDYIMIVPDSYSDMLKCLYPDNEYNEYEYINNKFDYQIMTDSRFTELVFKNDVVAIEGLYLPEVIEADEYYLAPIIKGSLDKYKEMFSLDKWKLRESFSHVASNSWVKAKKKLTVEKDYDLYIGQKSLFHSLRLLSFAIDICELGEIKYDNESGLYKEIMSAETPTWDYYYSKYHEIYNSLKSQLRELAPKP